MLTVVKFSIGSHCSNVDKSCKRYIWNKTTLTLTMGKSVGSVLDCVYFPIVDTLALMGITGHTRSESQGTGRPPQNSASVSLHMQH